MACTLGTMGTVVWHLVTRESFSEKTMTMSQGTKSSAQVTEVIHWYVVWVPRTQTHWWTFLDRKALVI